MVHFSDTQPLSKPQAPAPGGPNDPGASTSDDMQADTPGYWGGGDAEPTIDELATRPMDVLEGFDPLLEPGDELFMGDERPIEGLNDGLTVDDEARSDEPLEPLDTERIEQRDE